MSRYRLAATLAFAALLIVNTHTAKAAEEAQEAGLKFRPPATPLVACDPYFSIWSPGGDLAAVDTTHWTGKPHRLISLVRIDGKPYRLMGAKPANVPALEQTGLTVTPTQSAYEFAGDGVRLKLTFTTPLIPDDIDTLSRPITYLTYEASASDGKKHDLEIFFSASAELAVNVPKQRVTYHTVDVANLSVQRIGSQEQAVLATKGDDRRIDWGYLYVAAPSDEVASQALNKESTLCKDFIAGAPLKQSEANDAFPANNMAAGIVIVCPQVSAEPASRWLMLAYDDLYSIEFMQNKLRPYWRRNGLDAEGLLKESAQSYAELKHRCDQFDAELLADLQRSGGAEYAQIAALAYRQAFAAGKFVADANGMPLQFSKENHSNGCIATADVFYPMSPQFFLFGPTLAKSFLVPYLEYTTGERWKFPFAPHDLGTYPLANGQVYGGGERTEENQMPVEECGNVLILVAAVAQIEGNSSFADEYWPQLTMWAEYLKGKGFNPENQLCTDDFAGHLAHNVNLSAKAIVALGAYAQLCEMHGDQQAAAEFRDVAKKFADRWIVEANAGDHFRLTFDRPESWSQKYNLVWDKILGLDLFPENVRQKEINYYKTVQNKYGLPLDNRSTYTKLDWILWTATMTDNQGDFEMLVSPVYRFLSETPDKSPMSDWYHTHDAKKVGFTARPVVGGVFLKLLYDKDLWKKWAEFGPKAAGEYAPLPIPPKVTAAVPAADSQASHWKYSLERPQGDWLAADYDDSRWQEGPSGFGTAGTPGAVIGTVWNTQNIWLRRKFDLPAQPAGQLYLHIHNDEDAQIFINGVPAAEIAGFSNGYFHFPISQQAVAALKPTGNILAVHCQQTTGGQYIDVGISTVEEPRLSDQGRKERTE
jgi:hypothetical protein